MNVFSMPNCRGGLAKVSNTWKNKGGIRGGWRVIFSLMSVRDGLSFEKEIESKALGFL